MARVTAYIDFRQANAVSWPSSIDDAYRKKIGAGNRNLI